MENTEKYINHMAKFLQSNMEKKNIGPKELAHQTGLTLAEIRNMREGKLKRINVQNVVRLAKYFGCVVESILGSRKLPDELRVNYNLVEYEEPFYSYYGDRLFGIHDCFRKEYDEEYEKCVYGSVHSFVEAHKLASGYYTKDFDKEGTRKRTEKEIEDSYTDIVLKEIRDKCKNSRNQSDEGEVETSSTESEISLIGSNLRVIREYRKMSRKELSQKTKISEDSIHRIENGMNQKIDYDKLIKLSVACKCTLDFILGNSVDVVADASGDDIFYGLNKTFLNRHVEVGHDLAYVSLYMDDQSKAIVKSIIENLNLMYNQKKVTDSLNSPHLSLAQVYVREQTAFRIDKPNRGLTIRKREYGE